MTSSLRDQLAACGFKEGGSIDLKKLTKKKVRELVLQNRQNQEDAPLPYHFIHVKRAKKVYVTAQQKHALCAGELAIIFLDKKSHLLPLKIALTIQKKAPTYPVYFHDNKKNSQKNDDYAAYEVPDDLTW